MLFVLTLPFCAILVGIFLLPKSWWSSYFEFRDSVSSFLFVQHRLASVLVALLLLVMGFWLEFRAFRENKKFIYLTPFRFVLALVVVSIFIYVEANLI